MCACVHVSERLRRRFILEISTILQVKSVVRFIGLLVNIEFKLCRGHLPLLTALHETRQVKLLRWGFSWVGDVIIPCFFPFQQTNSFSLYISNITGTVITLLLLPVLTLLLCWVIRTGCQYRDVPVFSSQEECNNRWMGDGKTYRNDAQGSLTRG